MSNELQRQIDRIDQRQDERDVAMHLVQAALQKIVDRLDHPVTGDMALYDGLERVKKDVQKFKLNDMYKAGWLAGAGAVGTVVGGVVLKLVGIIK